MEVKHVPTHNPIGTDLRHRYRPGLFLVPRLWLAHLGFGCQLLSCGIQELEPWSVLVDGSPDRDHALRECVAPRARTFGRREAVRNPRPANHSIHLRRSLAD